MPPEAEGIAQDGVHPGFTGLIGHAVQVAFRILVVHVDGGRDDVVLHGHQAGGQFHASRGAQEVAGHGFGGADKQLSLIHI